MNRSVASLLPLLLLPLLLPACPTPERQPLPGGPPPEYETPRSYEPDRNIDGPGGKTPEEPVTVEPGGFEDDDDDTEQPAPAPSGSAPAPDSTTPAPDGSAPQPDATSPAPSPAPAPAPAPDPDAGSVFKSKPKQAPATGG